MALTINRNNEISNENLKKLKEQFNKRTNTQALYKCAEFVLDKVPEMNNEIIRLKNEKNELIFRYNQLVDIIKKKNFVDQELDNMVYTKDLPKRSFFSEDAPKTGDDLETKNN